MTRSVIIAFCCCTMSCAFGQWSQANLEEVKEYYDSLESAALTVLHDGETVIAWGDVSNKYNVASVRKSFLSGLFGIAYDRGWIGLDRSLAEMRIDDTDPRLTQQEKTATLENLLRSRSGVVHRSLYEAGWWDFMPARQQYLPGEYWIYNNWDFNALGTIWEKETGRSIHQAFDEFLAQPLGMQDFSPSDVEYVDRSNWAEAMRGNKSDHRLYLFKVSTRDMARFGQLYLNKGIWEGNRILSEEWIEKSTFGMPTNYQFANFDTHYGYLWWVDQGSKRRFPVPNIEGKAFAGTGNRGHYLYIAPGCNLVVAHTVDTPNGASTIAQLSRRFFGTDGISDREFTRLLELIVSASKLEC